MSKDKRKGHARRMRLLAWIGPGKPVHPKRPPYVHPRFHEDTVPHVHPSNPDIKRLLSDGLLWMVRRPRGKGGRVTCLVPSRKD